VWKAEWNQAVVAAKVTGCPTGFPAKEITLLERAQGEHSVKLLGQELDAEKGTVILMELCDGSLQEHIEDTVGPGRSMPCGDYQRMLAQILKGLCTLHARGIVFGDLKPDNLLMRHGRIIFADFGDARDVWGPLDKEAGWGSPKYHACPDVMRRDMTYASDMWMFAQTAVHLWLGQEPPENPAPIPNACPVRKLLMKCFIVTPTRRPTAQEAYMHCQRIDEKGPRRRTMARKRTAART